MMRTEATHTRPSEWCPRPEWWHAADGDATEQETAELIFGLVRAIQPELVVEAGTYLGHTARIIAQALGRNGHGWCDTVEPDPERARLAFRLTEGYRVTVIQSRACDYLPNMPVGLAYIDSDLPGRPDVIAHLWDHMEPGGLVVVHDTAPQHAGPDRIAELTGGRPYLNLRTPRGVLLMQVP